MSIFEVLSMLAPIMCYAVEGPDPDFHYVPEMIWKTITAAPEDDEGVITATYTYKAGSTTVINDGVTDIGPVSGAYDPEWDAFMAGEII